MPAPVDPARDPAAIATAVCEEALRAGFHRVGFAPVGPWERHQVYRRWLDAGHAGEMDYLAHDAEPRRDARSLLAGARTIVTVALSYGGAEAPVPGPPGSDLRGESPRDGLARGRIARYARGGDYHVVMKQRLGRLADALATRLGRPLAVRPCVDTAPLLEREAAHAAGLGFFAKNTMIIAPGLGSYFLLGELLMDVEAVPGTPEEPRCGRCRACLDACPTGAFVDAYVLDARRCISYLTIESRGPIPRALRPLVEDMIFGCDRCQEVCPFNAAEAAQALADPELAARPGRGRPSLVEILGLGAAQFRRFVRRTALRRIHRAQLLRNAAVALGNVGGPAEVEALAGALEDVSPLVRGHAAWALGRIAARHGNERARAALAARQGVEADDWVREEIALAIHDS